MDLLSKIHLKSLQKDQPLNHQIVTKRIQINHQEFLNRQNEIQDHQNENQDHQNVTVLNHQNVILVDHQQRVSSCISEIYHTILLKEN